MTWEGLTNEGVRLVQAEDHVGAAAAFRAALDAARTPDERAATLVNLAAVTPERAAALLTEAIDLAEDDSVRDAARMALGQVGLSARWQHCVDLNAQGAGLAAAGDPRAAEVFEAAYRETLVAQDFEALACRAAIAGNLAGVAGTTEDALRWSTEAVDVARPVLAGFGDVHGISDVLVNALVTRAQHLRHTSRLTEALSDLDEALALAPDSAGARSVRAAVLAAAGRFADAAAEADGALDLAYRTAPHLAASVHSTLAEIAGATGDAAGSAEHFGLVRDLSAATGDTASEAAALLSLARLAYLDSDNDRADALYTEAEARYGADRRVLAVCLHGRAAVEIGRGRPAEALRLLDSAHDLRGDRPTPVELIATHQVRGGALEALGDFAAADARYAEAIAIGDRAGLWHVALGIAWWRADALVRWASTVEDRAELCARALDLALPAALAAEAVRQRFTHGPLRERWVALAAAPATRSAFTAVAALGDVDLAAAYIDHLAATVSLRAEDVQPLARDELLFLPAPPNAVEAHLPYAASALAGPTADTAASFALPPRVRLDPAVPSTLDSWIDAAERRYGFPVRSAEAVASW
ncbi:hypothetical protein [Umezawaea sp. Da 62-37]|uniref:hypothetical protein n=1 Tax=Umezawaea sp. Da 62-37 TaxID=3075927 RepID=UPI0028F6FF14|nr:hypothetical protein [Umezawaea sp. Da 62-37]WNV88384.1 hypothetical protein RM788_08840 [Umezawaea sp. Da 62-37]